MTGRQHVCTVYCVCFMLFVPLSDKLETLASFSVPEQTLSLLFHHAKWNVFMSVPHASCQSPHTCRMNKHVNIQMLLSLTQKMGTDVSEKQKCTTYVICVEDC